MKARARRSTPAAFRFVRFIASADGGFRIKSVNESGTPALLSISYTLWARPWRVTPAVSARRSPRLKSALLRCQYGLLIKIANIHIEHGIFETFFEQNHAFLITAQ